MPLPVVGLFPWLVSLFAVILRSVFSWVMSFVALKYAARITLGTGMLVAIAGITLGVAVAVKAIIYGAQYAMPSSLGATSWAVPPRRRSSWARALNWSFVILPASGRICISSRGPRFSSSLRSLSPLAAARRPRGP